MKTKDLVFVALFTALLCVAAPVSVPVGATFISLATFIIFITGAVLNWKKAVFSVLIYILLGISGLPVFAGFSGGFQRIMSHSGGFILSYIPCVLVVSVLSKNAVKVFDFVFAMSCAATVCYLVGTVWFMIFTKVKFIDAALMCILPFIAGDTIKIIAGATVSCKLKPFLKDLNKEL